MQQVQNLLDNQFKLRREHGGEIGAGMRKTVRAMATRRPMLFTFKFSLAVDSCSFHRYQAFIHQTVATLAARFGVKGYKYSINSNHLHFLGKGETRIGLQNFLRTPPALFARKRSRARARVNPLAENSGTTSLTAGSLNGALH